jgi:hypothetical protein
VEFLEATREGSHIGVAVPSMAGGGDAADNGVLLVFEDVNIDRRLALRLPELVIPSSDRYGFEVVERRAKMIRVGSTGAVDDAVDEPLVPKSALSLAVVGGLLWFAVDGPVARTQDVTEKSVSTERRMHQV